MGKPIVALFVVLVAPICGILFIGWFFKKYPFPPPDQSKGNLNLFRMLDEYQKHHKGKIGSIVKYIMISALFAIIIIHLLNLLNSVSLR